MCPHRTPCCHYFPLVLRSVKAQTEVIGLMKAQTEVRGGLSVLLLFTQLLFVVSDCKAFMRSAVSDGNTHCNCSAEVLSDNLGKSETSFSFKLCSHPCGRLQRATSFPNTEVWRLPKCTKTQVTLSLNTCASSCLKLELQIPAGLSCY